ncbi:hypothetical protein [uncultured Cedecea sp.]|nr:hypothetical protein [uncultured Cedecea sp.]
MILRESRVLAWQEIMRQANEKQLDETLTSHIATSYLKGIIRASLKNS